MSEVHFPSPTLDDAGTLDPPLSPLPYRQAVPLIFGLSLGLWMLLWLAVSFALRTLFG